MREKWRRPNELASGCKTLAKQGSFAAVLLLSLHGSLESQTRNRIRVEPTGRAAEARRTTQLSEGNRSHSGTQAAHQGRGSVLKSTILAAPRRSARGSSAAEITGK